MATPLARLTIATAVGAALAVMFAAPAAAQTAAARYEAALARDQKVRQAIAGVAEDAPTSARTPVIREARATIAAYEALVRVHRASGYADNALHNAGTLADLLHERFGLTTDRDAALRLYRRLRAEYPTAPLGRDVEAALTRLEAIAEANAPVAPALEREAPAIPAKVSGAARSADAAATVRLTAIVRSVLPETVRVTLALDREVPFKEQVIEGPARLFFDLEGVEAVSDLRDAVLRYPSEVVRQIRVGRHPGAIRVVLDFEGVGRHTVYPLYNPFRIVVDAEPEGAAATHALRLGDGVLTPPMARTPTPAAAPASVAPAPVAADAPPEPPLRLMDAPPVVPSVVPSARDEAEASDAATATSLMLPAPAGTTAASRTAPAAPVPSTAVAPVAPAAPRVNAAGGFSIARQLGLGVSRIVIDPGHGGHDPGAQARGLSEADLTLDIALRLAALLEKEPGLEVILTRREDVYVPLEERTALANRVGADLFLSIHGNTSRNTKAGGVETYFLSFASSPDAEAVAARENSAHVGDMRKLPDIIKAIALNSKLDESRDFAAMVQEALVTRLRRSNKSVMNRGVKKAPFVVLIGAEMPSVLAEVSFMSNRQELALLKSAAYKQRIAEALHASVLRYRRSLKGAAAAAAQ